MTHPKSSVVWVGLLIILLPTLAILQYRWIGEVSAAERDRLENSLRVASDRFASDFDNDLVRISTSFQMRDGFPENAAPILERYQSWSENAAYPKLIRSIDLLRVNSDTTLDFYKVDVRSGKLEPAPVPKELEGFRERFRPGPQTVPSSSETVMLLSPIFRFVRPLGVMTVFVSLPLLEEGLKGKRALSGSRRSAAVPESRTLPRREKGLLRSAIA